MKNLKRLGVSVTLMLVLAVAVLAGETNAPPCAPPDPGETNAPPCAVAQMVTDDSVVPGETSAPPASNAGNEFSITAAIDLLQSVLLIF
jgi:hypothetical protein